MNNLTTEKQDNIYSSTEFKEHRYLNENHPKDEYIKALKETNQKYNTYLDVKVPKNWNPVFHRMGYTNSDLHIKSISVKNENFNEWIYWEDKTDLEVLDTYIEFILTKNPKDLRFNYLFSVKDDNQLTTFNVITKTYKTFYINNYKELCNKLHIDINDPDKMFNHINFYMSRDMSLSDYFKNIVFPTIIESTLKLGRYSKHIIEKYNYTKNNQSLEDYFIL